MDPDPMQYVEEQDDDEKMKEKVEAKNTRKLNTLVAISVALLATFMAICKTKDDNIVQAMQQSQADKIDNYSWYQARNIREEIAKATIAELTAQSAAAPPQAQQSYQDKIKEYQAIVQDQEQKKTVQQADAEKADKTYNELNYHDDQFDLSDAMLALAISLLALTALTQKRWLFVLAMLPTFFGILMGLAGLFGWAIHPNTLTRLLS
jgi:ABC-type Zn2+ transport system substrate-binding protein/surface adhesin